MLKAVCLSAFLVVSGCAATGGADIAGVKPTYLDAVTESVPNRQAIARRIWTPGLDEGFVPQGLTAAGPYLLVSSYRPSPDLKSNTGPCRVFRLERESGRTAGWFDLPEGACTHSGGLAYLGDGKLLLADTRQLFRIDLERAFASGKAEGAMQAVKIAGELRGSFAAFDGRHAWIGTWTKDAAKARMYRLDGAIFDGEPGRTVDHGRSTASIPVPAEAQGATFDRAGNLWVSASSGKFGTLFRLDRSGAVRARYDMVAGLEDLAFDGERLWGLSESGTRKYLHWETRFPFVFEIDVARLR